MDQANELQRQMIALVRAFGLHQGERTPCGKPLSVAEAHALLELSRNGGLAQRDLAAWLRLEKSTVSRLVSQLHDRGWVERNPDPADKRVLLVSLTAEGRRMAAELAEARRARFARLIDEIPAERREGVLAAIRSLVEAIDASV